MLPLRRLSCLCAHHSRVPADSSAIAAAKQERNGDRGISLPFQFPKPAPILLKRAQLLFRYRCYSLDLTQNAIAQPSCCSGRSRWRNDVGVSAVISVQQEDMFRASGGHQIVDDVFNEFSRHLHLFDIVQSWSNDQRHEIAGLLVALKPKGGIFSREGATSQRSAPKGGPGISPVQVLPSFLASITLHLGSLFSVSFAPKRLYFVGVVISIG